MKKILCFIALLLAFYPHAHSQNFPSYGKVTKEELDLKECAFDKDASAVVLLDEANSYYNGSKNLITDRHIRIKILKENGIAHANISIPYYRKDNFEHISDVRGIVINADNGVVQSKKELDKSLIFRKNSSELYGEVTFAFPEIKVGSIIEYSYESKMQHYGGLRDWYFQNQIPVIVSKYHLFIVPGYEFAYQVYKSQQLNIKVGPDSSNGSIRFEMNNIPGLDNEPFMDSKKDYVQRVVFQLSEYGSNWERKKYMTSWDLVAKEWMSRSDFGSQLNKGIPGTLDFIKTLKTVSSAQEKMKMVFQHVRSNITWNGKFNIISDDGVKTAWKKKTGNSAEINLILVNLLEDAGLEAYPMLVSERQNGKINTQYPFIDQFNTVYAAVFIDGKRYYLNVADPLTPYYMIPHSILNTTAFIVNKAGELVTIHNEALESKDNLTVLASVTPDGKLKGEAFMTSVDYAKVFRLFEYKRDKEEYISHFKKSTQSIDSFRMINEDIDSLPLQQKFFFEKGLSGTGDYLFVPVNLFSGFEVNPFISNKRFSDINFGIKRITIANTFLDIPAGYVADGVPKSITLTNVDKTVDFTRQVILDEPKKKILVRLRIDFKKSLYSVDEYEDLKEFYKKMFDLLAEPIVLKKIT